MSGLELNKIAAGVLVAGLIAMVAGKVADGLYHPVHDVEKRGYWVEVSEDAGSTAGAAEEEKPENILPLLADADLTAGEAQLRKCVACHTFEKGGANRVGPNLYDTVGADVGHVAGYAYSDAMASFEGSWDYNSLSAYLKRPRAYLPGTKMAFAGISREQERVDLIAYLRTLSDSPIPLPSEAEIAASMPAEEEAEETPAAAITDEQIAEEKADMAIIPDAGEQPAEGKTPDSEQAQQLEADVEARD